MYGHALSVSTRTLEMLQVAELNERLRLDPAPDAVITAAVLGLADLLVQPHLLDRAATSVIPGPRAALQSMPATARLRTVVASGAPSFPYLYGVFGESDGGRQLPAALHTDHLRTISDTLRLHHHQWGL